MILHAVAAFGVPLGQVIYIGDRDVDRAAADAARARFLDAESWRLRPGTSEDGC
jgi:hypothetical protein